MKTKSQYIDEAIARKPRNRNTYATDGKCHNSEPGTFGHECGKPATWIGTSNRNGFACGFCDDCKHRGWEAKDCYWEPFLSDTDDFNYVGSRHHY